VLVLFNLAAAAICLFIGIVCRDQGVANLIGSLVMLFSLLFAGLLLNHGMSHLASGAFIRASQITNHTDVQLLTQTPFPNLRSSSRSCLSFTMVSKL
jgi:hypothetical protein